MYNELDQRYNYDPRFFKAKIRKSSNQIGLCLLLFWLTAFVFSFLADLFLSFSNIPAHILYSEIFYSIYVFLLQLAPFVIVFFVILAVTKIPVKIALPSAPVNPVILIHAIFLCFFAQLAGSFINMGFHFIFAFLFGVRPIVPDWPMPDSATGMIFYFLTVVVIAAVFEEFILRGVVMQSLRRFGDQFALVVASILFALMHGNLIQAVNAFILGYIIGLFVLKTNSIWTGVIIHGTNNTIYVLYEYILKKGAPAELLAGVEFLVYIVFGVLAITFFSKNYPSLLVLHKPEYPLEEPKKYSSFLTSIPVILFFLFTVFLTIRNFERI